MNNLYDTLIIDGNNFLYRAFYVNRPPKYINDVNVTPVHQFLHMLKSAVSRYGPTNVVLTWDKKKNSTKKNFRKELVSYKEQRPENLRIEELYNTVEHIQKFIDIMGIPTIYPANMEADDVIRFLSLKPGNHLIISSDKDLLQLVNDNVDVFMPNKDVLVTVDNFEQVTSVTRNAYILYKSILGDISDNIDGLPRYGPVKSKALATELLSNNFDWEESSVTEEQVAIITRNITIMDLKNTEAFFPEEYTFYEEQLAHPKQNFDASSLRDLFREYQFHNFLSNFGEWNALFNRDTEDFDLLSQLSM